MRTPLPALTRGDQVLAECLREGPWHLYWRASRGDWDARCDRVDNALGRYGLGRN